MTRAKVTRALVGCIGLVFVSQGCASILGIETPDLDTGAGGDAGGAAGSAGQGGTAGAGGTTGGHGGVAGSGGATGGNGGQGGMPCVPKTCMEMQKDCGSIDNGCGATIDCGQCPYGKICGYMNKANECGGTLVVRHGYVNSTGTMSHSRNCAVMADGSIDCSQATVIQTDLTTIGITPDGGQHIRDRFGTSYLVGSSQKVWLGYLQSDGLKEWSIVCDIPDGAAINCSAPAHQMVMTPLPPMGLTLPAGGQIHGRYAYAYQDGGALKIRNGFIVSDPPNSTTRAYSQTCDVKPDGSIDCDPTSHMFGGPFTVPYTEIGGALDAGQLITDRFMYVTPGGTKGLLLTSGYVQADGKKSFAQKCDLDPTNGMLGCAMKPYETEPLPTVLPADDYPGRFAFEYIQ